MKKIIISFLSLLFVAFLFTSCDEEYDDFMTGEAKTGGLVSPVKAIPYKLGGTTNFDVTINIPKGPGIKSIEIYRTYTGKAEVLDRTVDVASANANGDITKKVSYNYAALITGLSMPTNELVLTIGNSWTLRYVSVMEDGRKVSNSTKTSISVANKYAGFYQAVGTFTHPTAGVRPTNETKFLTPIDANSVWANAGDLGSAGYFVKFTVNPATNQVTCSTWDTIVMLNVPGEPSYFDPVTGKFYVNYYYVGGSGNRVMREVYTPKP